MVSSWRDNRAIVLRHHETAQPPLWLARPAADPRVCSKCNAKVLHGIHALVMGPYENVRCSMPGDHTVPVLGSIRASSTVNASMAGFDSL